MQQRTITSTGGENLENVLRATLHGNRIHTLEATDFRAMRELIISQLDRASHTDLVFVSQLRFLEEDARARALHS